MDHLPMTRRLLDKAKLELERAEKALATDPSNEWRQKAVIHAQEKVDHIHQLLHDDPKGHA